MYMSGFIKKSILLLAVVVPAVYFLAADSFTEKSMPEHMVTKTRILLMTMNAENLFDTEHDPGKLDFPYMPKSVKDQSPQIQRECGKMGKGKKSCLENDWNETLLQKKLDHMTSAILANGSPDIILFQEVENVKVLNRLKDYINARSSAKSGHYLEAVLVEGSDRRGIDNAILSKLPLASAPLTHEMNWERYGKPRDSRGVLEATFRLPGNGREKITVFVYHFPAQMLDVKFRAVSMEHLRSVMEDKKRDILSREEHVLMVAGGDSNIVGKEESLWKEYFNGYIISRNLIQSDDEKSSGARGTHNYKGEWSYLDVLVFPGEMAQVTATEKKSRWIVDEKSARVANAWRGQYTEGKNGERIPRAFRHPDFNGVADHFPFIVEIVRNF